MMEERRGGRDIEKDGIGLPPKKPSPDEVKRELRRAAARDDGIAPAAVVYGLSELAAGELRELAPIWRGLPAVAKSRVLRALNDASEALFELNYREIALHSLDDASSLVRAAAIDLLWIDESLETMRQLLRLAESDADGSVRCAAVASLGRFILLGEYGDIPAGAAAEAQALALRMHSDPAESVEVRRRALEALANSSHAQVNRLIRAAYAQGNHDLKLGAIFAMGRSCSAIWRDPLLEELESADNEYVYEAVRACGEIQLEEAARRIGEIALGDDHELQMMAVWALGEIGGKRAFEILTSLEERAEDEVLASAIDEALDAAGFSLSFASLGLAIDDE